MSTTRCKRLLFVHEDEIAAILRNTLIRSRDLGPLFGHLEVLKTRVEGPTMVGVGDADGAEVFGLKSAHSEMKIVAEPRMD